MAVVEVDPRVQEFTTRERPLLIGGEWVAGGVGQDV